jgi:hypothetical protein
MLLGAWDFLPSDLDPRTFESRVGALRATTTGHGFGTKCQ